MTSLRIDAPWLSHPGTLRLVRALEQGGHQALFVGGCVRNALIGAPVSDIDIATDARPERVIALARAAGLHCIPTGIEHGTVTVIGNDLAHEVTTFRRDVDTDGRHATVAFSDDIAEDAARRDFTMNALYARGDGTIVDPLGSGIADLQARRLRFVGEPAARIREDYLRILRHFRFHAWYGDADQGMDPDALAAIADNLDGLERLARERVGHEMRKLLAATDPGQALAAMAATGVLQRILPGAEPRLIPPLVHLEGDIDPVWTRRLAVMGGEDATDRLRLSRAEAKALNAIRAAIPLPLHEAAWRHGADAARDGALVLAATLGQPPAPGWQAVIARAAARPFPVTAADLASTHQGPALGQAMRQLQASWLASGMEKDRNSLLAELAG